MKKIAGSFLSLFLMLISFQSQAAGPANVYKITIQKFELHNGTDWVTISDGASTTVDIASASAGAVAGTFLTASTVPDGTYSQSRVTIDNSISVKGNDGESTTRHTTAATASGGGNTVCVGTTTAADEVECTVVLATAPTATQTFNTPITIKDGVASHKVRVNFDTSQGLETAGGGNIVTATPTVTVAIIAI